MIAFAVGAIRMIDIIELETASLSKRETNSGVKRSELHPPAENLLPIIASIRDYWFGLENPPMPCDCSRSTFLQFFICNKVGFHYEFQARGGNKIGVEVHVEGSLARNNSEFFKNLLPELEQALGKPVTMKNLPVKIVFIAETFSHSDDVKVIVQEMVNFMTKTKDLFNTKFPVLRSKRAVKIESKLLQLKN